MHADGNGLYLCVKPSGTKSWVFRFQLDGKRREMGLGALSVLEPVKARAEASRLKAKVAEGVDPLDERKADREMQSALRKQAQLETRRAEMTFRKAAEHFIESRKPGWSNAKHAQQWSNTLATYAYPVIGKMPVADIEMVHILQVLTQETTGHDGEPAKLWYAKPQSAYRLLGRIKTVLDAATVAGYRSGTNPATWAGYLDTQLPSPKKVRPVKHHKAAPYERIGEVMAALRRNSSISSKALQFLCLTAVRSGSVRQAEWSEINFEKMLWVIPPAHTKTRQEHRVPLQPEAIAILKSLPKMVGVKKIFPSPRGTALSDMALSQLMRGLYERGEITVEAVPHGFRSTFRDWAAEQTPYPDEIRKAASGHTVGDAVQKAYQRTDLLEKRRELMNDWAVFLDGKAASRILKLRRTKNAE
jgi:integrase